MKKGQPITKEATVDEFKLKVSEKVLAEVTLLEKQKRRRGLSVIKKLEIACEIAGMVKAMRIMCES